MQLNTCFPGTLVGKESAAMQESGSVLESGRSPEEGNGNPLQYSCLGNPMDRGAWWATVHGVARVGHDLTTKPPPPYVQTQALCQQVTEEVANIFMKGWTCP